MTSGVREGTKFGGRDLGADPLQGDAGAFRVHLGLSLQCSQFGDAFLERFVADIGDATLDGVAESFQPGIGLGGLLAQFDRLGRPALGPLLAAIQDDAQHLLQPFGIKQPLFQMLGHQIVQPLHRDRSPLASGLTLPGRDGTGVVAIAS